MRLTMPSTRPVGCLPDAAAAAAVAPAPAPATVVLAEAAEEEVAAVEAVGPSSKCSPGATFGGHTQSRVHGQRNVRWGKAFVGT